jgi:hypothetical protein
MFDLSSPLEGGSRGMMAINGIKKIGHPPLSSLKGRKIKPLIL